MRKCRLLWVAFVLSCTGGNEDITSGPCGPNGECPAGYFCNPSNNLCYQSSGRNADAGGDAAGANTLITTKPASLTNSATATFEFSATAAGATFVCSLDGAPFSPCT